MTQRSPASSPRYPMPEPGTAFEAFRRAIQAIPDTLPGKTRLARLALRPFRNCELVRLPDRFGNVLKVPSLEEPISLGLFSSGVYEPDTLRAILNWLPDSGNFVDVGANIGALSLPVARCRPDTRIISIEADP